MNAAPEGATFWFEAGVHRLQKITPKANQTFLGETGAVLNGSQLLTSFTQQGSLWVASGQTQEGLRNATGEAADGALRGGYPETFFIDDKPLKPVDALSKVVPGTFYFDYAADKIYFADNPTGHKVEAGKLDHAFRSGASGVTIKNLVVEKYNAPVQYGAIHGDGSNWTVQNTEVRLNYGVGIYTKAGAKVLDNYVHDNGQMGLGGNGNNILVEGNEIARNGHWSGIDPGWEAGGTKWAVTDNLVVRNNYTHHNNGSGFWTDIDNIRTLYEGNLVTDNWGSGIVHEISYAATIRNNTLSGNGVDPAMNWLWGSAILVQNSQDVDIYGNTVDMTGGGNGIGLIQQSRGTGVYGEWLTTDNKVHDNVLISRSGDGMSGIVADWNDAAALVTGNNVFSGNRYYMDGGEHWTWDDSMTWAEFSAREPGSTLQSPANAPTVKTTWSTTSTTTTPTSPTPTPTPTTPPKSSEIPGATSPVTTMPTTSTTKNGTSSSEHLTGTSGNDKIIGNGGHDWLYGKAGFDVLTGGSGADTFVFDTAIGKDVDWITDFDVNADVIRLNNDFFPKMNYAGMMQSSMFRAGTKALDSNDFIIYDQSTGTLSYDADASGANAAVTFAVLQNKTALKYDDIVLY